MQRKQKNSSRIDLADLKGQIVMRIGVERSKRYFYYLSRLLTQKLSKCEFDKLCMRLIGKDNLSLHNHFIRSILKNACDGIAPPSAYERGPGLAAKSAVYDGHKRNGYEGFPQNVPWSNRTVSPKKGRSCVQDRKLKDQPGLPMPNGTVSHDFHLASSTRDGNGHISTENGGFTPCDYQRPVQKLQEFAEPPMSEREALVHQPRERLYISTDRGDALHNDGSSRLSIHAPLGIPFCGSNVGGSRRPVPAAGDNCFNGASVPDTASLQKRMEQIALYHGLEGVSMETANILNNGLDLYLKQLITSCVSVMGRRSGSGKGITKQVQKQQIQSQILNGLLPNNHHYIQNKGDPSEASLDYRSFSSISMFDFKVAMKLNPQQLGEDWPLLMEKISMGQFTE